MKMAEGRLISPWMNPGALRRHLVKHFGRTDYAYDY